MEKHFPPAFGSKKFHCIHCGVFAAQSWHSFLYEVTGGYLRAEHLSFCICSHCDKWSYWFDEKMIVPPAAPVPPPHVDMPKKCVPEYEEARNIVAASPRAAAALMRLALQKLMTVLGEKGKNINDEVGALVKKGLPLQVQQALDFCRVVGNNAAHPGEIELNDTPEIAHNLFSMMNFIIEDRISRPKHIEALYSKLPEGARNAISQRDEGKKA